MYSRSDCSGLNGLKYGGAAEVARALSWTGSKLRFHRSKHSIQRKRRAGSKQCLPDCRGGGGVQHNT